MKAYYFRQTDGIQAAEFSYLWVNIPENQVEAFEAALLVVWPKWRLALGQGWDIERFTVPGTVAPVVRRWDEGMGERVWNAFADKPQDRLKR